MFDSEVQIQDARTLMREYTHLRAELDELEAMANDALGKAILAYECLDEIPEQQRPDRYRASRVGKHWFGEDLIGKLALANRTSEGAARILVSDVAELMHELPDC